LSDLQHPETDATELTRRIYDGTNITVAWGTADIVTLITKKQEKK